MKLDNPSNIAAHCGRRVFPGHAFVEFYAAEVESSIARRFERQIEKHGDRLAIAASRGEMCYRDLNRFANHIAVALIGSEKLLECDVLQLSARLHDSRGFRGARSVAADAKRQDRLSCAARPGRDSGHRYRLRCTAHAERTHAGNLGPKC